MITKDNLKEVLQHLKFVQDGTKYIKKYHNNASIKVDFQEGRIEYLPLDSSFKDGDYPSNNRRSEGFIIHRNTTTNFSSNENFVCLLAVDALLDKGYKPHHIILEPTFKVGHNQQVYGDILILNEDYENLVLIENKTYGAEFSKEWNNTIKNGGQLFSYHAVNNANFLCLLAYDFDVNTKKTYYKTHIISMIDNQEYLDSINADLKDKDKKQSFADAKNAKEYYEIWSKTYGLSHITRGLLEQDIQSYRVGKEKYTTNDLIVVPYSDIRGIYHEFATILRNNAIGNYENTFYILVDLFLCKITDEIYYKDDLKFYWKGVAYDNPLDYCDRLLSLYEKGVKEFFKRDVINISKDTIENIFETQGRYKGNLKEQIEKVFKKQKFYNIKKFNFIEVENEEEFELNFKVLIQITSLIQDFYISKSENNQFLGDLFEGFLNRSIHQTEGRFFTPMPITNFIINSLPELDKDAKVLDFACGAGHFLTEYLECYEYARVYGIEKNKDLSKVAKVACIFHNKTNSKNNAKIIFQDALDQINEVSQQDFKDESFDLIISNPPYSVKGFLSQLDMKRLKDFKLSKNIDEKSYETNNAIECFFVERAKQLLKNGGYFALILPISILQKSGIYQKTRELLNNHFNILSIVELNQRTFGSTGTQTAIIFAKKCQKNSKDLVNFLESKNYDDNYLKNEFLDTKILEKYCNFMDYPYDDFKVFLQTNTLSDNLKNTQSFETYFQDFNSNKPKYFKKEKITKLKQEELFKQTLQDRQDSKSYRQEFENFLKSDDYKQMESKLYNEQFLNKIKILESKKLTLYINIYKNDLILIKSPPDKTSDNKSNKDEIIKFLGYDWSNRKGDEGIKYNEKNNEKNNNEEDEDNEVLLNINSIKYIDTPLYNPQNKDDENKLCFSIKSFIESKSNNINIDQIIKHLTPTQSNSYHISMLNLSNMIDFKKADFDNAINLNIVLQATSPNPFIDSKYPLVKLEKLIFENPKSNIKVSDAKDNINGKYPFYTSGLNIYRYDEALIKGKNIYLSTGGNAIVQFYDGESAYSTDTYAIKSISENEILTKFIFYILNIQVNFINQFLFKGMGLKHLQKQDLKNIYIPLPPLEIQKQIIKECEEVENYIKNINDLIKAYENLIKAILYKAGIITQVSDDLQSVLKMVSDLELSLDSKIVLLESNRTNINKDSKTQSNIIDSNHLHKIHDISLAINTLDSNNDFNIEILKNLLESIPTPPPQGWDEVGLDNAKYLILNPSRSEIRYIDENTLVSFIEMASVSNNGYIKDKVDKTLKELKKGSYTFFIEDDILMAKITPCMENGKCAIATDLTNNLGMGSSEFHVFRAKEGLNNKFLFVYLNRDDIRHEAARNMTGASGHRRVPIDFYKSLQIPLPPLKEQEKLISIIDYIEHRQQVLKNKITNTESKMQDILQKYLINKNIS